jgi:hypothetical protein
LVPLAITFAFSLFVRPVFALRYIFIFLTPFLLLVAAGLARLRSRWILAAALLVITVSSARGLRRLYSLPKQDWRGAATLVGSQEKPHDAMIFYPYYSSVPFRYYWQKLHGPRRLLNHVEISSGPYTIMPIGVPDPNLEQVNGLSKQHDRVWWISRPDLDPRLGMVVQAQQIEEALAKNYRLVFEEYLTQLRLRRYERIPPEPVLEP